MKTKQNVCYHKQDIRMCLFCENYIPFYSSSKGICKYIDEHDCLVVENGICENFKNTDES